MAQKYREIKLTWWEGSGVTWLTVRDKTEREAWDNARFFGCIRPRWYQFWIRRPIMEKTL